MQAYVEATKKKTERERSENKEKTGVELKGIKAINPATKEEIPVYVADYVLGSYGTGAVMAVPAHDERDFEFAKKHNLPLQQVVKPIYTDKVNAPREDVGLTKRNGVIILIKHWSEDKYLLNASDQYSWRILFTGGIEEGEDPLEAAKREVLEETGYKNIRSVTKLPFEHFDYFYRLHKGDNAFVSQTNILVELADGEQVERDAHEAELHQISWKTKEEMLQAFTHDNHRFVFQYAVEGGKSNDWDGILIHSGEFDGRPNQEAIWDIVAFAGGERTTNYRIRDWLISRQRYWGCPIPVVYDPEGKAHVVPEEHMPWLLPEDVDFTPTGKAPLASSQELKERVTRIFGEGWTPEYDTLDTFVDSSWYFLRYVDHADEHNFSDMALMKKWLPVDRYSGGSEHTTMHLLYARFFHKALYDLALVPTPEPFNERFNRGLILGPDGQKMSKRWGNVVNPDDMRAKYGADAVRMYLAFLGPYSEPGHYPWKPEGVEAMRKLLDRMHTLAGKVGEAEITEDLQRSFTKTSAKMKEDADRFKFNTALSSFMTLLREAEAFEVVPKAAYLDLLRLLAPYAPHLAEHLWEKLGQEGSVHTASFPEGNPALLQDELVPVIVQVNGKRKGEVMLALDASEDEATKAALELAGIAPDRVVYVPGRIVNLVLAKK